MPAGNPLRRLRWVLWAVALGVGVAAGLLLEMRHTGHTVAPTVAAPAAPANTAAATWAAGKRPAPDFSLTDAAGRPVSLARFRGRPVLLTFMDPLCQDFCPLEAKVVNAVEAGLPAASRPHVIAVSVNVWGNTRATLLHDVRKWKLTDSWSWAIGKKAALAKVWANYDIGVQPTSGHDVAHTEAMYLIDARGDQRAIWLWPFRAADVLQTLQSLG